MDEVAISSRDYWLKVVDMLQQNWALVDVTLGGCAHVYFLTDGSGVFDELEFVSVVDAENGLERNGFRRFASNPDFQKFLRPPVGPFRRWLHPNGPIYSSGRFWKG